MSARRKKFLPYGRQDVDGRDVAAVAGALRSDWLTTGPRVEAFETALAKYCGAKHAVAVANGTAALHVAMLAAGLKPGDRALTSANTFLASANCAEFAGATADFADIDPRTYNVTAGTLRAAWKDDVRAVVPVDFAGQPCDMPAIAALARERGAVVIEDASHAIGGRFEHGGQWHKVGGHAWADMTTFSFHPVKTITTGEGGAILTRNDRLAERCRLFRNHGMVKTAGTDGTGAKPDEQQWNSEKGPWFYEMAELGFNYRITDLQCALGLSQLKKLGRFVRRRAEIVAAYNAAFASLAGVQIPQVSSLGTCPPRVAWHLYVLQMDFAGLGQTRTQVMQRLRDQGVGTQVHYIPVHLQPYYRRRHGYGPGKCPVAEAYYERCLSLPLYPAMTDKDVEHVIRVVRKLAK
jgi:UDP-4-amino-4,6-dideoxy-N-acetyl-beta-L-altrosamine transaminase